MGDGTSGAPTFCFSFTSDAFEIYHLVDYLGPKGWRFNGQQYPNAIHMAVTRPQTQPGVVESFTTDLAGAIYGGVAGGLDQATSDFIVAVMDDMLDKQQALPPA